MKRLQPNSIDCFACGLANDLGLQIRFYDSGPGEVSAEYEVDEKYQGYPGVVHGGIVAAMLDEVTARTQLGGDVPRFMFTAKLDVRYRKIVPIGVRLQLVGRRGKNRGRTATATGAIYNPEGELLAQAEALLIDVPQEILNSVDLDALGWKVYDEDFEPIG